MRRILALLLAFIPFPAAAQTIQDRPALWKLSDQDTTIWLFGTIHMLAPGYSWYAGPVAEAFTQADTLALETRIPDPMAAAAIIQRRAIDPAGRTLATRLTPDLHTRLIAQLAAYSIPSTPLEPIEPWYVAIMLETIAYQRLGFTAESGVESNLVAKAEATTKAIVPLESFDDQIGFLDSLPPPQQILLLQAALDEVPDAAKQIDQLVAAWRQGDVDRLATLMNESLESVPEIADVLLAQRNVRWADWIAVRMDKPGNVFIAVGAGHLGGTGNVRALLEARGLTIARIQ